MRPGFALGPKQYDHSPIPPGETFEALLSVGNAIVLYSQHGRIKRAFDFSQINSVFVDVCIAFYWIPCDYD